MNFVGFYLVPKGDPHTLHIGPYCADRVLATGVIPFGKGQCGATAEEGKGRVVNDTRVCANYIPCDDVTLAEVVVPVYGAAAHWEAGGADGPPSAGARDEPGRRRVLLGVLDIDSEELCAFDEVDVEQLTRICERWFS